MLDGVPGRLLAADMRAARGAGLLPRSFSLAPRTSAIRAVRRRPGLLHGHCCNRGSCLPGTQGTANADTLAPQATAYPANLARIHDPGGASFVGRGRPV